MARLSEYKPTAYAFPDSLNLFVGGRELTSTVRSDYGGHLNVGVVRAAPTDCLKFSTDKVEGSTTIKDAYRPYSGRNYVPTAAARLPTADGNRSAVRTTKAIHIPARPRTQMSMSNKKIEGITSYSYQFAGDKATRDEPFRPKTEMEGPMGDHTFESTSSDYLKHNYGRPDISSIPDNGLFDKVTLGKGTTSGSHFGAHASSPKKSDNLRPKTSVLLGSEKFVARSSYKKQFDGIKKVYGS